MPEHPSQFFARVQEETAKLKTEDCFLTSVEHTEFSGHTAGRVMALPRALAGQYIAKRTHRLSTQQEVDGWKADQITRREEILRAQADTHPKTVMDSSTAETMATVATNAAFQAVQQMNQGGANRPKENK